MADVDGPLVELGHHQDCSHCLLLSVSNDGHLFGPLLKVLHTEPDSQSLVQCAGSVLLQALVSTDTKII